MKKVWLIMLIILLYAPQIWAASMNVQYKKVDVKATPNYMSPSVGKLSYGSQVDTVETQGNWYRISSPPGWIPKSAVTKRKVAVDADKKFAGRGVSHDEAALAGKGFNPQVEAEYRRQHPNMAAAYAKIDWMERQTVSLPQLKAFSAIGKLQ